MHSIWKGAISFGLVTIPVKLYPATATKAVQFKQLHNRCRSPIKYRKYCPACQEEVAMDEIVRGYEYAKGHFVIITDDDLQELPLNTLHSVEILNFVTSEAIDPIFFIKSYYLAPSEFGHKAYRLLHQVMLNTGRVAVARVVLRVREELAVVRPYQDSLLLATMHYSDEIRPVEELPEIFSPTGDISRAELKMATQLVDNLTTEFKPEQYTSRYREALQDLINARINDYQVTVPRQQPEEKVIDLLAALKASVAAAEEGKSQPARRRRQKAEAGG